MDDIVDGKKTIPAVDFGYQQDEIQKVAKLFADILMIAIVYRGDEFVEFGSEIFFQGSIRLAFVPWTALLAKQFPDCAEELGEVARC
ncbi:hypothetical protein HNQ81_000132 [Desulfoprunum benzoelyticum]|uniref:Uncharacterized protein n=1 Tax=Desulfoprunum benzoelyticum TaxID=1506996 RepID=A0A840ULB6_9BACT|nr:hypothetical protein [Desulfoprunum benzoelyticum]